MKKDFTSQYNAGYVNQDLLKYISWRRLREEKEEQDWKEGEEWKDGRKEEDRGRRSRRIKVNKKVGEKERTEGRDWSSEGIRFIGAKLLRRIFKYLWVQWQKTWGNGDC